MTATISCAVLWRNGQITDLGVDGTTWPESRADAVNADGTVVAGLLFSETSRTASADYLPGMEPADYLLTYGVQVPSGVWLDECTTISDNGLVFGGNAVVSGQEDWVCRNHSDANRYDLLDGLHSAGLRTSAQVAPWTVGSGTMSIKALAAGAAIVVGFGVSKVRRLMFRSFTCGTMNAFDSCTGLDLCVSTVHEPQFVTLERVNVRDDDADRDDPVLCARALTTQILADLAAGRLTGLSGSPQVAVVVMDFGHDDGTSFLFPSYALTRFLDVADALPYSTSGFDTSQQSSDMSRHPWQYYSIQHLKNFMIAFCDEYKAQKYCTRLSPIRSSSTSTWKVIWRCAATRT